MMQQRTISAVSLWEGVDEPLREDIDHSAGNGGLSIRRGFWKLNLAAEDGGFAALSNKTFSRMNYLICELTSVKLRM